VAASTVVASGTCPADCDGKSASKPMISNMVAMTDIFISLLLP
jgi:hypothetical protein